MDFFPFWNSPSPVARPPWRATRRFYPSPFLSSFCALFGAMGTRQLLCVQALLHSFYRNGGVGVVLASMTKGLLPSPMRGEYAAESARDVLPFPGRVSSDC